MKNVKLEELTNIQRRLLDSAERVIRNAYNPYSHFYVGAALLTQADEIITGCNVENAVYGSTLCAERGAVLKGNSIGMRLYKAMALIARGENFDTKEVIAPCGPCRQVLYESSQVSGVDLEIILSSTKKDKIIITTISELLPLAFGPKDLGIDITKYQR
jgi:cytidine deaminase